MDLLQIPGDTGGGWRLKKFGEFAHYVRAVDPLTLEEYHKRHRLNLDDTIRLFWLLSSTYSEITAIIVYNDILATVGWDNLTPQWIEQYWKDNKSQLKFGSSRRYAKSLDWFPQLLIDFNQFVQNCPSRWLNSHMEANPEQSYNNLYQFLVKRKFMGRFSTELFLLNFTYFYMDRLWDINIHESTNFNWRQYSNETSGLLNLFYQDELANDFDRNHQLSSSTIQFLDEANKAVRQYLFQTYGEYDAAPLIYMPRICTFRNFCKQQRYAGFHHDRQLEFLLSYQRSRGNTDLIQELFDIRKSIFPHQLLGELHNWRGIRSERKKLFVTTGLTGAEAL